VPSFGRFVAIDGDTIVVGAFGQLFVYSRVGGVWQTATPQPLAANDGGRAGSTVAIDGNTIVAGSDSGVYVFDRDPATNTWTQEPKVVLPAGFGFAVAISGDTIVTGSSDTNNAVSAYALVRSAGG
jgi:hypothetical protein